MKLWSNFGHALHALKKDMLRFRFEYPLEVVPNSGFKDSLSYYLYGDQLSWEALRLDDQGVPRTWFRITGEVYLPGYVAWYGLVHLGHYLRSGNHDELNIFIKQVDWLEEHAVTQGDGAVVWPMNFDYRVGDVLLKSPWVSAHAQGFCISALVRGWRVTRNRHLLDLLEGSTRVFEQDHHCGGVRIPLNEGAFYAEIPGEPMPGILDGFLTSLLGLYDLVVETGNLRAGQLFLEGVAGLKILLPLWDYRGKWSWYGGRERICSPAYHCLNRLLLLVLAEVTGECEFAAYCEKWNPGRFTALDRAEIYLIYNWTLNISRLRHRTWRLQPSVQSRQQKFPHAGAKP
jgi:hypothetical protein